MKFKIFKTTSKTAAVICALLILVSCAGVPTDDFSSHQESSVSLVDVSDTETSSKPESPVPPTSSKATAPSSSVPPISSVPFSDSSESETNTGSNIEVVKSYDMQVYFGDANFSREVFNDSVSGKSMPFRLHIPDNFDSQKKYPVILFLHGAGEIGSDNESHIKNFAQSFEVAGDMLGQCIIVCPQTPAGWGIDGGNAYDSQGNYYGYLSIAKRILDEQILKYNGDLNRIYLTGLSLGSFANWTMLEAFPNFFAAAVPVCGGTGGYVAPEYLTVPIWLFHGTHDDIVGYDSSAKTYDAILSKGGKIMLTTLHGVKHNAWDYAYTEREMFSWLFSQNRSTKQDFNYESVNLAEIVTDSGDTVFNEYDITNSTYFVDSEGSYVELYLTDAANEELKEQFRRNKKQVYTFRFCEQAVYDFRLKEFKNDGVLRLEKTVDDTTFKRFNRIIQRYAIKVAQRGN